VERMTSEQFRSQMHILHGNGASGSVHKDDNLQQGYQQAVETLRNLQSLGGALFLGSSDFKIWTQIFGKKKQVDGDNVYKGICDSLNKIAYQDDCQNQTFRDPCPWSEGDDL